MLKVVLFAALCAVTSAQGLIELTALAQQLTLCRDKILCDLNSTLTTSTVECIDVRLACDGKKDCSNGKDELMCPTRCAAGQVVCRTDRRTCANGCTGTATCTPGNEDEFGCPTKCTGNNLLCNDRTTCTTPCNTVTVCPTRENIWNCGATCANNQLLCNDHMTCAGKCDGLRECPTAEDESCPFQCLCSKGEFICGSADENKCIPRRLVCNEVTNDCRDNSDETGGCD